MSSLLAYRGIADDIRCPTKIGNLLYKSEFADQGSAHALVDLPLVQEDELEIDNIFLAALQQSEQAMFVIIINCENHRSLSGGDLLAQVTMKNSNLITTRELCIPFSNYI